MALGGGWLCFFFPDGVPHGGVSVDPGSNRVARGARGSKPVYGLGADQLGEVVLSAGL